MNANDEYPEFVGDAEGRDEPDEELPDGVPAGRETQFLLRNFALDDPAREHGDQHAAQRQIGRAHV